MINPFKRPKMPEMTMPTPSAKERTNRYKFSSGQKVRFTKQAIQLGIHEGVFDDNCANQDMWVRETKDVPFEAGSTGQWITTDAANKEWYDAHWFEISKTPDGEYSPYQQIHSTYISRRMMGYY